jgi:hypothetical protein
MMAREAAVSVGTNVSFMSLPRCGLLSLDEDQRIFSASYGKVTSFNEVKDRDDVSGLFGVN